MNLNRLKNIIKEELQKIEENRKSHNKIQSIKESIFTEAKQLLKEDIPTCIWVGGCWNGNNCWVTSGGGCGNNACDCGAGACEPMCDAVGMTVAGSGTDMHMSMQPGPGTPGPGTGTNLTGVKPPVKPTRKPMGGHSRGQARRTSGRMNRAPQMQGSKPGMSGTPMRENRIANIIKKAIKDLKKGK